VSRRSRCSTCPLPERRPRRLSFGVPCGGRSARPGCRFEGQTGPRVHSDPHRGTPLCQLCHGSGAGRAKLQVVTWRLAAPSCAAVQSGAACGDAATACADTATRLQRRRDRPTGSSRYGRPVSRRARRAIAAPSAIVPARAPAIAFVWTHVRQALQHVATAGACSP
jgi:hypothetical protein